MSGQVMPSVVMSIKAKFINLNINLIRAGKDVVFNGAIYAD